VAKYRDDEFCCVVDVVSQGWSTREWEEMEKRF
jgi:hypothetical protein